jgi:hypothetical protein
MGRGQPNPPDRTGQHGDERKGDREDPDPQQIPLVKHDGADRRGDPAGEQASSAGGQAP